MSSPARAVARYLAAQGLLTLTGPGCDTFDSFMPDGPDSPDKAVAVYDAGGPESSASQSTDQVRVRLNVRGDRDNPNPARERANTLRDALHGLRDLALSDGTVDLWIVGVWCGPVQHVRTDTRGRHEYAMSVRLLVENPTALRG